MSHWDGVSLLREGGAEVPAWQDGAIQVQDGRVVHMGKVDPGNGWVALSALDIAINHREYDITRGGEWTGV